MLYMLPPKVERDYEVMIARREAGATPTSLDFNKYRDAKDLFHILAVLDSGPVEIWQVRLSSLDKITQSVSRISLSDKQLIVSAKFIGVDTILIVYGPHVKPFFQQVTYLDGNSNILPNISVKPLAKAGSAFMNLEKKEPEYKGGGNEMELEAQNEIPRKKKKNLSTSTVSTVGALDMKLPQMVDETYDGLSLRSTENSESQPYSEKPVLDIKTKLITTSSESMGRALVQAIHTNDRDLLEQVLKNQQPNLVINTVSRIPPDLVVPFLVVVVKLCHTRSENLKRVLLWVKAVFEYHISYLLTVPNLQSLLTPLNNTLEERVSYFDENCQVQGKLNFLLSFEATGSGVTTFKNTHHYAD
eukprot:TRINITY_DN7359_c0_g2_i2.p1 TRINITY_DN7359_c0_g2~~TRINITY_DN7359_c0_g2_i2.p1  ORF type:complete len:358 (-),score=90.00 TRINITY_DN7359_c0_g2_i2:115-1188(-)